MKFLLKILFAPVIVILTLIIWTFALTLRLSAWVLGIIGTILGLLGLAILLLDSVTNGIIVLVIAFLVNRARSHRRKQIKLVMISLLASSKVNTLLLFAPISTKPISTII